jgi:4a-hydroxytetrahydrobiopterin dehydratase
VSKLGLLIEPYLHLPSAIDFSPDYHTLPFMNQWIEKNNRLEKEFKFSDFVSAWGFLTQVAIISEKQNHHATITNTYNHVHISMNTHDAGNTITERDHKLAKAIDAIVS